MSIVTPRVADAQVQDAVNQIVKALNTILPVRNGTIDFKGSSLTNAVLSEVGINPGVLMPLFFHTLLIHAVSLSSQTTAFVKIGNAYYFGVCGTFGGSVDSADWSVYRISSVSRSSGVIDLSVQSGSNNPTENWTSLDSVVWI